MNAHKRHGFTHSDVVDYGMANRRMGREGRIALNAVYLRQASHFRHMHAYDAHLTAKGMPICRDVDCATAARRYIAKAREWRQEVASR